MSSFRWAVADGRLGSLATRNPRDLFGDPGPAHGWIGVAVAWPLLLVAVFRPLSVRAFRRLSR